MFVSCVRLFRCAMNVINLGLLSGKMCTDDWEVIKTDLKENRFRGVDIDCLRHERK